MFSVSGLIMVSSSKSCCHLPHFAHDLFEYVLDRHEATDVAVLINNNRHVVPGVAEFSQQVFKRLLSGTNVAGGVKSDRIPGEFSTPGSGQQVFV